MFGTVAEAMAETGANVSVVFVPPAGTKGAFPGAPRPFTGEEVKKAFRGQSLPGTTYDQSQAYLQYIRRLQAGQSGFTCFASIQMPR